MFQQLKLFETMTTKEFDPDIIDYCSQCGEPIYNGEDWVYANPDTGEVFSDLDEYSYAEAFHVGCEPSE